MHRLARIVFKNRFVSSGQDCLTSASPVLLLSLSSRVDASIKDNCGLFSKNSGRIGDDYIWRQYREYSKNGLQRQSPETEDHLSKEGSGDFECSLNASTTNEFSPLAGESVEIEQKRTSKSDSKRLKIEEDVAKQFFENESVDTSNYKLFNLTGNYLLDIGSSRFRWGFPLRRKPKSWKPVPRFYASRSHETVTKGTMHSYIANVGEGIQRRTRELVGKLKSLGTDSSDESYWKETSEMCPENPFVGCESSDFRPLQPMSIHEVPASPLVVNKYLPNAIAKPPSRLNRNETETQNYAMNYVISLKEPIPKITESTDQKYWTLMQLFDENKLINIQPVNNSMLKNWGLLEFFESQKNLHENAFVKIMKVPVRVSMQEVLEEKGRKSIKYIGQHSEVGLILIGENAELLGVVPQNLYNDKSLVQPTAGSNQEVNSVTANLIIACLVGLSSSTKSNDPHSGLKRRSPYFFKQNSYSNDARMKMTNKATVSDESKPFNFFETMQSTSAYRSSGYETLALNMLVDIPENPDTKIGITEAQEVPSANTNPNLKEEASGSGTNKLEMQSVPTFTLVPFEGSTAGSEDGSYKDTCKEKGQASASSVTTRKSCQTTWYPTKSGLQTQKPPMNVGTTCSSHSSRRSMKPSVGIDKTVILSRPAYNQSGPNGQYPRVPIMCYPKQKYLVPDEHGRIRYPKPCTYDCAPQFGCGEAAAAGQVQIPVSYKSLQNSQKTLGAITPYEATIPCEETDQAAAVEYLPTAATYKSSQNSYRSLSPTAPQATTLPCEENVHAPFQDHIETAVTYKSTQNSCNTIGPTTPYLSERISPTEAAYASDEQDYESVRTIGEETECTDSDLSDNVTIAPTELSQKPYCDGNLPENISCECPQDSVRLRCCPWHTNQPCPPIPGSMNGQSIHCCPWPCDMQCPEMSNAVVSSTRTEVQTCKCAWPCGVPCPRPPIDLPEWTEFPEPGYPQSSYPQSSYPQPPHPSSPSAPSYDSSYGSLYYQTPSYPSSIPSHGFRGNVMSELPTGASMVPISFSQIPSVDPFPKPRTPDIIYNPTKIATYKTGDPSTQLVPFSGMESYKDYHLDPQFQGMQKSIDCSARDNMVSQGSYSSWIAANEQTGYSDSGYYSSANSQPESSYYGSEWNSPESQFHGSSASSPGFLYYAAERTAPGSQNYPSTMSRQDSNYFTSAASSPATGYYTSKTSIPQSQYYASEMSAPESQCFSSEMSRPDSRYYASEISPQDSRYYSSEMSAADTQYYPSGMNRPDSPYYASEISPQDSRYYSSEMSAADSQCYPSGMSRPESPYYASESIPQDSRYYSSDMSAPDSQYYPSEMSRPDSQYYASEISPQDSRYYSSRYNSPGIGTPDSRCYASDIGSRTYSPSGFPPSGHYTLTSTQDFTPQSQAGLDPGLISRDYYQAIPSRPASQMCTPESNFPQTHQTVYPSSASARSSASCMPCIPCPCCPPNPHPYFIPQHEYLQGTIVTPPSRIDSETPVSNEKWEELQNSNAMEASQQTEVQAAKDSDHTKSQSNRRLVANAVDKILPNHNLPNIWSLTCLTNSGSSTNGSSSSMSRDSNFLDIFKSTESYSPQKVTTNDDKTPPSIKTDGCSITASAKSLEGIRKKETEGKRDCESVSCSESRSLKEYQPIARIPHLESSPNSLQAFRTMESVLQKTESQLFPETRYCDPTLFGVLNGLGISDLNKSSYCGEWIGSGDILPVTDPSTSSCIADVILPTANEIDRCIIMAKEASNIWANLQSPCRSVILNEIARRIAEKSKHLAKLISFEVGKVVADAMCEVRGVVRMFEYAAGLASVFAGNIFESERSNHIIMERFLPMGTTGIISAFNTPYSTFGKSASISLAVGNTVLLKPAPTTALSSMALMNIIGETFKAYGLPPAVICVQGDSNLGRSLADDKRIDILAFSGSQANGHDVGMRVQNRFGKSLLNLAGNNSLLVSHDANFELALDAATVGIVDFAGQKKQKISHIIVHRLLYDQFVENLVNMMKNVGKLCGNPLDPRSMFGPLHSNKITEKYLTAVQKIRESGGSIEVGGEHIEGNFVEPTIVTGIEAESDLVEVPTIGPLAFVFPASDMEQAIEINNKFSNRLSSSVFTKNVVDVYRFIGSRGLAGGVISINTANTGTELTVPLGGDRAAGGGRLSGSNIWQEYCRRVAVNLNFSSSLPYANGSSCTHIGGFQIY